ncbi:MAG: D-glycero-beta-D-manno-heptose 1-phosphate adenylyltransferase [Verrucomicrobia bacterium]|nr:D-glycero-beta-D-manno-heptose 1-phosphate adenylyltransferase [Verrucomicrobiota bacterium]
MNVRDPKDKILTRDALVEAVRALKAAGRKIVFTNGCFDVLHVGHVRCLREARLLGDALVVGLNADSSVRALKGPNRPLQHESERAEILASLECVDYVTLFAEQTPLELIGAVVPDVLVKGGDWAPDQIVGREIVEATGGLVTSIPVVTGRSSTDILTRLDLEE